MSSEDIECLLNIENYFDVEESFEGDDDKNTDLSRLYDEHSWPEDVPTGYSYKGKKKPFVKAVEGLKILMKKGNQKIIDDVTFKVLDSRKKSNAYEYDVEVSKDKERGVATMKIFGPKEKKGCTILLNKSKKYDIKFLEILAFGVIKRLLDCFENGDGWINFFNDVSSKDTENKRPFSCHFCNKGFVNEKNLRVHIERFHRIVVKNPCEKCEFEAESEITLKDHVKQKHGDKSKNVTKHSCEICEFEAESETNLKEHVKVKHGDKPKTVIKNSCGKCEFEADSKTNLNVHVKKEHGDMSKTEEMEIDTVGEKKECNKRTRENSNLDSLPSSPPCKRSQEEVTRLETIQEDVVMEDLETENVNDLKNTESVLKDTIPEINKEHDKVLVALKEKMKEKDVQLEALAAENKKVVEDYVNLKEVMNTLKKQDGLRKAEVKKLKEENNKLNLEIGKIQFDKDKFEANVKAEEKLRKIKANTKLFNEIIEKQLVD